MPTCIMIVGLTCIRNRLGPCHCIVDPIQWTLGLHIQYLILFFFGVCPKSEFVRSLNQLFSWNAMEMKLIRYKTFVKIF